MSSHEKLRYLRSFFERRCLDGVDRFEIETQNLQIKVDCVQGKFECAEINNKKGSTKCTPIVKGGEEILECFPRARGKDSRM